MQVYRKKWVIHIERITREKVNGGCTFIDACQQPWKHVSKYFMICFVDLSACQAPGVP